MRSAIIENGVVTNVILGSLPGSVESETAQIGDLYDGENFTKPPPPVPTIAEYTAAVQQRLDTFAQSRNYDGILSLCTYATSSNPRFAGEGQRGVDLRDTTWADCYAIMADVQAGNRLPPSIEQLLSELPALTWPA